MSRLRINSKHLTDRLIDIGRGDAKPKSIFPTLSDDMIRHFIRGYLDGDGSIGYWCDNIKTGHCKFSIKFCGVPNIIYNIGNILDNKFGCKTFYTHRYPNRDNNNIQSDICGNRQCLKILDWLYKNATIYLTRKHNTYLKLVNMVNKTSIDTKLYGNAYPKKQVINLSNLAVFESVTKAAKSLGVSPSIITTKCKNENGFMYYNDYLELSNRIEV